MKFHVPVLMAACALPACAIAAPTAATVPAAIASGAAFTPVSSTVFTSGEGGFPSVRIPSIISTPSGVLIAFAEGRKSSEDQSENKIISRRSTDGGKTWMPVQTIADDGARPLNNPCAVVDKKTGRLLLMFQSYPKNLKEDSGTLKTGYVGEDIVKTYLTFSDNDGKTWSSMADVTRQVKHPFGATSMASGPGVGIQLKKGPHAGRLLIPFNEGPYNKWHIYTAYSDDGGSSWKSGKNVPSKAGEVNECQLAELSDGRIYFNSRAGKGTQVRRISYSDDGGETWSPVQEEPQLVDSGCMASVLSLEPTSRPTLVYSGPKSEKGRDNGTVFASYDDGKTWAAQKVLEPGMFGYSNLVQLPDGNLGCLYEANDYKNIVFKTFSLQWLTDGAVTPVARQLVAPKAEEKIEEPKLDPMLFKPVPPGLEALPLPVEDAKPETTPKPEAAPKPDTAPKPVAPKAP